MSDLNQSFRDGLMRQTGQAGFDSCFKSAQTNGILEAMSSLDQLLASTAPILALAPMQDVTDLQFWTVLSVYGGADVYVTEYFRVHPTSNLDPNILRSITHNPTGRPVIAQMIGNDIPALVRTARELQQYPIAAVRTRA